jgi:hypothetical protein
MGVLWSIEVTYKSRTADEKRRERGKGMKDRSTVVAEFGRRLIDLFVCQILL